VDPLNERLFGQLRILTPEELEQVLAAAFRTLATVGVIFEDPEARDLLHAAGATVEGNHVRLPEGLVSSALAASPEHVVLNARNPAATVELGLQRFVTTNGFGTTRILDARTGEARNATAQDMARLTRLADELDQVGFCQHQVTPVDLPQHLLDVALPCIVLSNTSKHCHLSTYSAQHADRIAALGEIAGDRLPTGATPVYSLGCCPVSPLRFPGEATALLRRSAERGIPFLVVGGAVAGVMSPVTLAGTLVVQTAELLAASTLAQTVQPGSPIAWGSFASPMNPRTSRQQLGTAELSLLNGATAQICRRCGVPFGYGTGGITDSSRVGVRAGMQKGMTTLAAALAGVEVIHDAVSGILSSGLTVSYEQMVIDNEMCRVVRRFVRGIRVDEETLGLAAIEQVGPGGSFIATSHTAKHFRNELLLSDFWEGSHDEGESAVIERAGERARALADSDPKEPLADEQVKGILRIWSEVGLPEAVGRALIGQFHNGDKGHAEPEGKKEGG